MWASRVVRRCSIQSPSRLRRGGRNLTPRRPARGLLAAPRQGAAPPDPREGKPSPAPSRWRPSPIDPQKGRRGVFALNVGRPLWLVPKAIPAPDLPRSWGNFGVGINTGTHLAGAHLGRLRIRKIKHVIRIAAGPFLLDMVTSVNPAAHHGKQGHEGAPMARICR